MTGIEEIGEDHPERRDSENLHSQMVNGGDHPHPTGTTQIISPQTTIENEKEMTEEVKAIDFMKNVHQTEDLHLMITSEIDLLTRRTILHMTLLLTLPTPKREDI